MAVVTSSTGDVTVDVPDGQQHPLTAVPIGSAMTVGYWEGNPASLTETSTGYRWLTVFAPSAAIANVLTFGGLLGALGSIFVVWSIQLRRKYHRQKTGYKPVMIH